MAKHNETGCKGEGIAVDYFRQKGYKILYKNWRKGRHEIDIIADFSNTIHFVEVKTRTFSKYLPPEYAVNKKKLKGMMMAAAVFMEAHTYPKKAIQFDVLAITLKPSVEIRLIEDVYFYNY